LTALLEQKMKSIEFNIPDTSNKKKEENIQIKLKTDDQLSRNQGQDAHLEEQIKSKINQIEDEIVTLKCKNG